MDKVNNLYTALQESPFPTASLSNSTIGYEKLESDTPKNGILHNKRRIIRARKEMKHEQKS